MGCQKKNTEQIIKQNGDYAIALKAIHPTIHNEVSKYFETQLLSEFAGVNVGYSMKEEKGHGRIEKREYWLLTDEDYKEALMLTEYVYSWVVEKIGLLSDSL